ncbi:unnamed protein product [Brugia timori]|uniref:Uncharacterized protein n=1 Tax=Brugia timori TaxID=42155 RepID=A0A0R3QB86_9BILA|nr:unnamed protein product [Brugia timori]
MLFVTDIMHDHYAIIFTFQRKTVFLKTRISSRIIWIIQKMICAYKSIANTLNQFHTFRAAPAIAIIVKGSILVDTMTVIDNYCSPYRS